MANVSDVNFVIPCHELYMRTVLQKELTQFKLPTWLIILITALCSSSLFIYLDKWWIVAFIFVAQLVLSLSYQYTRRIVTIFRTNCGNYTIINISWIKTFLS